MVRDNDVIVIEDLRVKNMIGSAAGAIEQPGRNVAAKRGLNRAISNQAWATFRRRLTDKTTAAGTTLVAVNPANTSRRCNACGHTARDNRESQAVFHCTSCGRHANADHNILTAGQAVTGRRGTAHAQQAQCPNETSTTREAA